MTRSIASATQTKLAGQSLFVVDLIELQLATPQYLNTSNVDIDHDSDTAPDAGANTYLAQGKFLGYGAVSETSDIRVSSVELRFSAVDTSTTNLLMNNDYIDKRVVIYRLLLDDDYTYSSDDIFMIFDGTITGYSISEEQETAEVIINVASQFADFERTNGRRTNPASQNIHFASDRGLDFAPEILKDIRWGRP